ncbi:hypothetical protein GLOTRDRAFT_134751 [Gloeophyllum trabeum ATCC 11539]|uniref:Uncharacterized protein n=1 Tax=Gloeophyllum trabeum (strain ATCC 11539 / FP-39264 / Madison 617) TaxID=670483 RepID=S7QL02_GLOTA|nr:uncharacterized protein GLOTRDRAFT_134751 [Gloeophyllum trabeum ATCC 11539]EPQ59968.1 hypothetical protein GLOTRDRAFT_134751 [Gloeophyllum trabeum ATCC 11539]
MASKTDTNGVDLAQIDAAAAPPELQGDIALLASFLSVSRQSTDDLSDADIAELLRQLEAATGVAEGVESRLDGILGSLDSLLEAFSGSETVQDSVGTDTKDSKEPNEIPADVENERK